MRRRSFLLIVALVVGVALRSEAQTALEDKFFTSSGVKVRYVDVGRGEPVVLIHGFSSSLEANWSNQGIIDKLSKDFRVIALDCRGHGKSDKPHDAASYGLEMIEDVARLLDHLAIRKAHIVGYSMGGAITGKFITTHPDRVLSAVFGGSAPRMGWTAENERGSEELAVSLESGQGMRPLILRLAKRRGAV
jgi:pimeloyl-ACP methyl ester carboxylesterase